MYKHINAYRNQKWEWDEIREQRVFRAISERCADRTGKRTRYGVITGVGVAAAALTAIVIGLLYNHFGFKEEIGQRGQIADEKTGTAQLIQYDTPENASVLTLGSVGQVTLFNGADVFIIEQQSDVVYLKQEEGQALYDIIHREGRLVQVRVSGIVITVVGTVFMASIDEATVHIEVKRGVVQVDNRKQIVTLKATEAISVAIPQKTPSWSKRNQKKRISRKRVSKEVSTTEDLFNEVDKARRQGDLANAAQLLHRIVAQKASSYSVASAEFTLGKVERARGRHTAAARAFCRCAKKVPNRSLGEDALAEAALSWHAAGNVSKAKAIAHTYLDTYPKGMYIVQIKRLVD